MGNTTSDGLWTSVFAEESRWRDAKYKVTYYIPTNIYKTMQVPKLFALRVELQVRESNYLFEVDAKQTQITRQLLQGGSKQFPMTDLADLDHRVYSTIMENASGGNFSLGREGKEIILWHLGAGYLSNNRLTIDLEKEGFSQHKLVDKTVLMRSPSNIKTFFANIAKECQ